MKAVARSYMWWPGIDKEIEKCAQGCMACPSVQGAPAPAPLHPWLWPDRPWDRIHIDFTGPFLGRNFLLIVDAHSKWPEVIEMRTTSATQTIQELRQIFAAYGLPRQMVSDNGPQFCSEEFRRFAKENGIKHISCSPYHPSSNGAVERIVQTAMDASNTSRLSVSHRLSNFLLAYRTTPHMTTNKTPAELFLGRNVRTCLDLIRPDTRKFVERKQGQQKAKHDQHAHERTFPVGQTVMVRNFRNGPKWVSGVVIKREGPVTYLVRVDNGNIWKRHVDHTYT